MFKCFCLILTTSFSVWAVEPALTASTPTSEILCLRAIRVPQDLATAAQAACPTNSYSGLVLDLRFADGDKEVSTENFPANKKTPLVILVNGQTRGAAANLVAKLRSESHAVVIGNTNTTDAVRPDITVAESVEQETSFQADPYAKPVTKPTLSTNELLPLIDHTSEAELVRHRVKDGDDVVAETPRGEPAQPVLQDPELARAVDLLKALAVLHKSRG